MQHYVYIIYSKSHDKYYKGYSINPQNRLIQHNNKKSNYTSNFGPWELVFIQEFNLKKDALIREKSIKKYSKTQILHLINSQVNQM